MVGGVYKDVLMQCFERRCLTYTPDNPEGWQVEAGNVGQHYYQWRYGGDPESPVTATQYRYLSTFGLPDKGVSVLGPNDVAAAPNGDIYVTNTETFQVLRFDRQGILITAWGSEGSGNGQFGGPRGIAVDSQGNVYVVDKKHDRVQKFDPNGAFLLAFGGTGTGDGQLEGPHDVAVGPGDIVFVTDQGNNRIQKFDVNGGYLGQWGQAGSGPGQFAAPHGIDVSPGGLVYVADSGNDRVQVFDANGVHQGGFGSTGAGEGQLDGPTGIVAVPSNTVAGESIYVTETENDRVSIFSPALVVAPAQSSLQAIQYDFSGYLDGSFVDPMNADADAGGRIFVADRGNDRIQVYGSSGPIFGGIKLVDVWVDDSRGRFSLDNPDGVDIGPDGTVYTVDNGDDMIKVFSADGQYVDQYGPVLTNTLTLQNPVGIAIDQAGFIYVTDEVLDLVVKLNASGEYVAQFGATGNANGQFQYPSGIDPDEAGNIYVADVIAGRIQKFAPNFDFVAAWSEAGETPFDTLLDVAVYGSRLYVTDSGNANAVHVLDLEGNHLDPWEGFNKPTGIDTDSYGYVFVGDVEGIISKFSPDGELVVSFANAGSGNGQIGVGTVGPRLALDADGNVYVADYGNQRVVVFEPVE
jgi:DNA-binding beta-propeller fold protein YncE